MGLFNSIQLDIVQILSYGLTGLTAICVLTSMYLINKEGSKEKPNKEMLKLIRFFMIAGLIAVFVVGIFSLPVLNKANNSLSKENVQLDDRKDLSDSVLNKFANDLKMMSINYTELSTQYASLTQKYEKLNNKCGDGLPLNTAENPKIDPNAFNVKYLNRIDSMSIKSLDISNSNLRFLLKNEIIKKK